MTRLGRLGKRLWGWKQYWLVPLLLLVLLLIGLAVISNRLPLRTFTYATF
jgi:hypothetical protein